MPRDLFGDVTRPSISIGNRKWYTVPVSLISHSLVIAAVVVLPLIAAPLMPGVIDRSSIIHVVAALPTPPPPPAPRSTELKPVENLNAAPTVAPDSITKEPVTPPEWQQPLPESTVAGGVVGGTGADFAPLAPPPPAAAPPKPVRPGGAIRRPIRVGGNEPVYPAIAQAARVQGIVIIEATISADGRIVDAHVLRSIPLLDAAALDAVRTWQYTPTMLNGEPVPVIMTVTVTFTLSR